MTKDGLDRFDGLHQLATYDKNAMHRLELVLPKTLTLQSAAAVGHIASGAERKQWEKFGIRFAVTNDPVELVVAQLTHQTVLATTVNHCGQVYMEGLSPHSVVVVVTQPVDNLDDALYFWNIRASIPLVQTRFLAVAASPDVLRAPKFRQALEERITALERFGRYARPTVLLDSLTATERELRGLASDMGFDIVEGGRLGETASRYRLESPPRTASVSIHPLQAAPRRQDFGLRAFPPTQLHRPKTVLRSPSPVVFNPEIGGYVFARFSGAHPIDVPSSPSLGPLFMQVAKATRSGIEFLTSPAASYNFDFSIPESAVVLHALLRDRGVEFQLNDKGRHAHGILAMCGGMWSYSDETSMAILKILTTPRSSHLAQELKVQYPEITEAVAAGLAGRFGQDVRQRTLPLGEIASAASKKEADIAPTLGTLVAAGLVLRGLMIRCDTCGLNSFSSIASPTEVPACPGCGSAAEFAPGSAGKEPGFWYRLNALVDRATDQGALAVLLAHRAIKNAHPETDLLLGVDLTLNDRAPGDLDLLGRLNREILTGEAKMTAAEFTDEQIDLDVAKASRIGANVHVMSCPAALPPNVATRARERFGSHGIRIWIVSAPMNIAS
jgi:hypothetical protein